MSEISELEVRLAESQKKLKEVQFEINAIQMELINLKGGVQPSSGSPYRNLRPQGQTSMPPQGQPGVPPQGQPGMPPQGQPGMPSQGRPGMPPQGQQGMPPRPGQPGAQGEPGSQAHPGMQAQPGTQAQGMPPRQGQPQQGYWAQGNPHRQGAQPAPKKSGNAESVVGIKVMGIVASVLIFISFILFAMIFVPVLPDPVKMAMMFIISGIMALVGLVVWFKQKESVLFLSIGACGIGAIYISLFVSNIYFHIIGQIPLYILLIIWAAGVLYLSKFKKLLFEIIGLSGIIISVFFGAIECSYTDDSMLLGVLSIYFIVGVLAFMLLRLKDNVSLIITNISALLGAFVLVIIAGGMHEDAIFTSAIMGIFSIGIIILNVMMINEENYQYLPFICLLHTINMYVAVASIIRDPDSNAIITLLISVIIYVSVEAYYRLTLRNSLISATAKGAGLVAWEILLLLVASLCIINLDTFNEYIGLTILVIPLLVYGYLVDSRQAKISAIVLYGCRVLTWDDINYPIALFFVIAVFALFLMFLYKWAGQYHIAFKLVPYCFFMVGLHMCVLLMGEELEWNFEILMPLLMLVAGVINFLSVKTPFKENVLTKEEELPVTIVSYVINACLMLEATILMFAIEDDVMHVMVVLMAILLFVINSYNLLKDRQAYKSIYVGIKFTILLICILASFGAPNYVLSIAVFALSVGFIMLGFKLQIKSLRIYGLVTTMIFAIKLIMFDIAYDNILGNALSFFLSGLMCFGISALYSVAEKKMSQ